MQTIALKLDGSPSIFREIGRPTLSTATEHSSLSKPELMTTGDVLESYDGLIQKLETFILSKDNKDVDIQSFIRGISAELHDLILKCVNQDEVILAIAQKIFHRLYENSANSVLVSAHLAMLGTIRDGCKFVVKEITSWVVYLDEERKFNKDITVALIHSELLNISEYDVHLTKIIDGGRNKTALDFVMSLVYSLIVQDSSFSMSEFCNLLDLLTKLSTRSGASDSLHQLIEMAKNSIGTNLSQEEKSRQFMDKKTNSVRSASSMEEYISSESLVADPIDFREKVSRLFSDWFRICESPANDAIATCFLSQLQKNGLLNGDDLTDHFFRIITEISVTNCLTSEQMTASPQQIQQFSFLFIDISIKLVVLILKYPMDLGSSKVALLPKILSAISKALLKDVEERKLSFNPRPYFRFFVILLMDLTSPDSGIDGVNYQVLTSFANAFHALQPLKVPSMSFAWLELISHRSFMPKLLMISNQKGWPFFQRLLVDLFKFMEPHLRSVKLEESIKFLYRGTLRVLLVLLHDFPQFLCDYHFCFCDVIPSTCIQLRNIILSAFPVNMRLPDPCTPNLKIDLLPEISQSPCILSDIDAVLKSKQIKVEIDEYLKTKNQGSTFLTNLKRLLFLPSHEISTAGTCYNVPLMNSLVLYVGMQAIQQLQSSSSTSVPHTGPMDIFLVSAAMDIFNSLIVDLDLEGRYTFLNAVANQLRYPNNHTHYFSFVLLYFFVEAKQEIIQEQITLVLLERLIVNRPHPWGLLITFIELIKNPRYDFWNKSFIHSAPEIEHLFDQVSKSCGGPRGVDDVTVSGSCLPGVLH
ncbi:hypothetical protein ZOSMA_450G00130 [Zostera marina]|uniref:Uncharacterized protein n=1 Tax=Zostera marina TaxID=29655 RepID=A0A0K9P0P5_ZOSMR|nr:hypothetical protein ZOSMA_450G00130 [Zostera marina]